MTKKRQTKRKSVTMSHSKESHLEQRFERIWQKLAPTLVLEKQVKGIVPGRRYIYDFRYGSCLFEINGGIFARGYSGHSSGAGIQRDAEKVNRGQLAGYSVFVLTIEKLTEEYIYELIQYALTH